MTFEDRRFMNINKIETILGIKTDEDSHLVDMLYDDSIEEFCSLTNRTETQLKVEHCNVIRELTIFKYRQIKSNLAQPTGIKSLSEGGVSITYQTNSDFDNIPSSLMKKINKYRLNRIVNRKAEEVIVEDFDVEEEEEIIPAPPPIKKLQMYYGRLSIGEVGGSIIPYSDITAEMITNSPNITKANEGVLGKTSMGLASDTAIGDYVVVAVPYDYVVTKDNGIGGKTYFNEVDIAGANGISIRIDGLEYLLYGEVLNFQSEIFIYVDKKEG